LQAGAGIVADSVATEESLECRNKAAALIAAIPAARRMTNSRKQAREQTQTTDAVRKK
jgi:anthranilate synthase component 1